MDSRVQFVAKLASSIAKAAFKYLYDLLGASFSAFRILAISGHVVLLKRLANPYASATIKTLIFNLLECRNRYGIEV